MNDPDPTPPPPTTPPKSATSARVIFRRLGPAGPLAVAAVCLPAIGTFVVLWASPRLAPWLRAHGWQGMAAYVVVYWVLGGMAFLPTYAHSALGGWTFGFWPGLAAALTSYAGAAMIGYAIARRASGERVTELIHEHARWQAVSDALLGGGFWKTLGIVTLVRIPPNSPFAMTNVVMAATRVPPAAYILGTLLGIAPRTAAVVYTASRLQQLSLKESMNWWMVAMQLGIAVVVIAIIGHLAKRALEKVTG